MAGAVGGSERTTVAQRAGGLVFVGQREAQRGVAASPVSIRRAERPAGSGAPLVLARALQDAARVAGAELRIDAIQE